MGPILIVDDSKAVHAFVDDILTRAGFDVKHVFDGSEAIEFFKSDETSSDIELILLDWEMPIKTGPEVLEFLTSAGIKIPVVMMTSKNETESITRMLQNGASEYVIKPFTEEIILAKIKSVQEGSMI